MRLLFLAISMILVSTAGHTDTQTPDRRPSHFSVLVATDSATKIQDVCCGRLADKFPSETVPFFDAGQKPTVYWLRFDQPVQPAVLDFGLYVDKVTLYRWDPQSGQVLGVEYAGDNMSSPPRTLASTHNIFHVGGDPPGTLLFARIEQSNGLHIRPTIWTPEAAKLREAGALRVHLLLTGGSLIMIVFNLAIGFVNRQPVFVLYACFFSTMIVTNLFITGLGPAYLWPSIADHTHVIRDLNTLVGMVTLSLFVYHFQKIGADQNLQWITLPAIAALPVFAAWLLLPGWLGWSMIAVFSGLTILYLLVGTLLRAFRGHLDAAILVPALCLVVLPRILIIVIPKNADLVWTLDFPLLPFVMPMDHYIELLILVDVLLFSILLAYRMRRAEVAAVTAAEQLDGLRRNVDTMMLRAVDDERRRFASDLHDTAGQGLLAVTGRLSTFLKRADLPPEETAQLQAVARNSRAVIGDIRRVSHDLHPAIIDHLGWRAAIEELANGTQEASGIAIHCDIALEDADLDPSQQLQVYRVVQEVMTNIAKHSGASDATIHARRDDRDAVVKIIDDGMIADLPDNGGRSGVGQAIIRHRVQALSGQWSMARQGDQTVFEMRFPLGPDDPDRNGRPG